MWTRYLPESPEGFRVLIRSQPPVVVTGDLSPATSEDDATIQLALADASGLEPEKARFMVLDQRTNKARRIRYKLRIHNLAAVHAITADLAFARSCRSERYTCALGAGVACLALCGFVCCVTCPLVVAH